MGVVERAQRLTGILPCAPPSLVQRPLFVRSVGPRRVAAPPVLVHVPVLVLVLVHAHGPCRHCRGPATALSAYPRPVTRVGRRELHLVAGNQSQASRYTCRHSGVRCSHFESQRFRLAVQGKIICQRFILLLLYIFVYVWHFNVKGYALNLTHIIMSTRTNDCTPDYYSIVSHSIIFFFIKIIMSRTEETHINVIYWVLLYGSSYKYLLLHAIKEWCREVRVKEVGPPLKKFGILGCHGYWWKVEGHASTSTRCSVAPHMCAHVNLIQI